MRPVWREPAPPIAIHKESRRQGRSRHRTTSNKARFTTSTTFNLSSGDEKYALVRPCFWLFFVDVVSDVVFLASCEEPGAINYRGLIAQRPMNSVAEAYGSRTHPRRRGPPRNGFEDRETHRDPYTSTAYSLMRRADTSMTCCHTGCALPHSQQYLSRGRSRSHELRRNAL